MRERVKEQDRFQRRTNFEAVEENLTPEQVKKEAQRCLNCKNPRCVQGCPVGIQIPKFIQALKEDRLDDAGEIIREKSLLFLQDEVPHGIAVVVNLYNEKKTLDHIQADIIVNNPNHKQIVIGENGSMLMVVASGTAVIIE